MVVCTLSVIVFSLVVDSQMIGLRPKEFKILGQLISSIVSEVDIEITYNNQVLK